MREEKMLEKAVVFDIDGTLCDDTSRRKDVNFPRFLLSVTNNRFSGQEM